MSFQILESTLWSTSLGFCPALRNLLSHNLCQTSLGFEWVDGWRTLCPTSLGFCPLLFNSLSHTLCQTSLGYYGFHGWKTLCPTSLGFLNAIYYKYIMANFMPNFIGIFVGNVISKHYSQLYVQLHWDFFLHLVIDYFILYIKLHWDLNGLNSWKTLCPTSLGFCLVLSNLLSYTLCQTSLGFEWFTWVEEFMSNFIRILSCTV